MSKSSEKGSREVISECERELVSYLSLHDETVRKQLRLRVVVALLKELEAIRTARRTAVPEGKGGSQR